MTVVAEIKRRSPSRGSLQESMDVTVRARDYAAGGAVAISVLTEPAEFGGSNEDLIRVRAAVTCPVLRKDFHVDPVQVLEARAIGASAVLLIVRALGPSGTRTMSAAARDAGIEALFEVRDEAELEWALEAGGELIGVNRRNLESLAMEPDVLERLLPAIPATCVAIAESGIRLRADVAAVATLGVDAVLVGGALSTSAGASDAVRALPGYPRTGRG